MNKQDKLEMLQKLDEKTLTKRFVILFYKSEKMGYKNVRYTHRALEFGKDVVCYKDDEYRVRRYTGIQVKKTKITARNIRNISHQILEADVITAS